MEAQKVIETKQDLIEYFESIPENMWIIGNVRSKTRHSCAIGHVNRYLHNNDGSYVHTHESSRSDAHLFLDKLGVETCNLADVNNGILGWGNIPDYKIQKLGKTPKERTLTYLRTY